MTRPVQSSQIVLFSWRKWLNTVSRVSLCLYNGSMLRRPNSSELDLQVIDLDVYSFFILQIKKHSYGGSIYFESNILQRLQVRIEPSRLELPQKCLDCITQDGLHCKVIIYILSWTLENIHCSDSQRFIGPSTQRAVLR
jgi:hypothetical protein